MTGKFRRTQLHIAARKQAVTAELVASAVKEGTINTKDNHGFTPLYHAAMFNDTAAIELLLASGADIEMADLGGLTPLHIACEKGRPAAAVCLLKAGANHDAKDSINRTPLDWAVAKGHTEVQTAVEMHLEASRGRLSSHPLSGTQAGGDRR